MRAMKVLTVLHSHNSGGAEHHALQLMKGLRARGHEPPRPASDCTKFLLE